MLVYDAPKSLSIRIMIKRTPTRIGKSLSDNELVFNGFGIHSAYYITSAQVSETSPQTPLKQQHWTKRHVLSTVDAHCN
jgi:hypothetical protein